MFVAETEERFNADDLSRRIFEPVYSYARANALKLLFAVDLPARADAIDNNDLLVHEDREQKPVRANPG